MGHRHQCVVREWQLFSCQEWSPGCGIHGTMLGISVLARPGLFSVEDAGTLASVSLIDKVIWLRLSVSVGICLNLDDLRTQ
jgi:hypothetical protein